MNANRLAEFVALALVALALSFIKLLHDWLHSP